MLYLIVGCHYKTFVIIVPLGLDTDMILRLRIEEEKEEQWNKINVTYLWIHTTV